MATNSLHNSGMAGEQQFRLILSGGHRFEKASVAAICYIRDTSPSEHDRLRRAELYIQVP
jgi:hypothetical protein